MPAFSARKLALQALRDWRTSREFADAIIQRLFHQHALRDADRRFAQELFYGVLRHLRSLDFLIAQLRPEEIDPGSRDLARLGLLQLFNLGTPEHAAVFETVAITSTRTRPLINGILRSAVRRHDQLLEGLRAAPLDVQESHPEFLVRKWIAAFGEAATEELCRWNNEPAPLYARINLPRTTREAFLAEFPGAHVVPGQPLFAHCEALPTGALARGLCYVQDPSTAVAVDLLGVEKSDRVLDACAAPGGKATFLATLQPRELVACDHRPERLDLMRENLTRLGLTKVKVQPRDWLIPPASESQPDQLFDKILLDVPCTNTGVMRRRIDVRWRLTPADFVRMPNQQLAILRAVITQLRPGGVIVYSTCSLEREENEAVVERILGTHPDLELETTRSVLPFRDGFDGAFAARLRRQR